MHARSLFSLVSAVFIAVGALGFYFGAKLTWPPFIVWVVALSVVTFFWYGFDKFQAKRNGLRVPEIVLHGLTLMGGFPGGFAGRWVFRHKTQKRLFAVVLWASLVVHLGLAGYLFRGGF